MLPDKKRVRGLPPALFYVSLNRLAKGWPYQTRPLLRQIRRKTMFDTAPPTLPDDDKQVTYDDVNGAWGGIKLPPITAAASNPIFGRLVRKFGGRKMRLPPWSRRTMRSWAAPKGSNTAYPRKNGLPRMVHDASHWVFGLLHPTFKTHSAAHAALERQMIEAVLAKGWHLPKEKPAPVVIDEMANIEARIKKWRSKAKRAATAIRKLERKAKRLRARNV